jgi:hypothetical protein
MAAQRAPAREISNKHLNPAARSPKSRVEAGFSINFLYGVDGNSSIDGGPGAGNGGRRGDQAPRRRSIFSVRILERSVG